MNKHTYSRKLNDTYVYLIALLGLAFGLVIMQVIYTLTFTRIVNIYNPAIIPPIDKLDSDPTFLSASFITQALGYLLPLVLCLILLKRMFLIDIKNFNNDIVKNVVIIIVGFFGILIATMILGIIYKALGILGDSSNQEILEYAFNNGAKPILFVMTVILAPIFEELIFRKFIIGLLESLGANKWLAFAISTIVFAGIHVISDPESYIFIFQYLALSAIITLAYIKSNNNIVVSTIIHVLNNSIGFL